MNKKTDPRLLWAIGLSGAVMALWLVLVAAMVWATLSAPERAAVGGVLGERMALVFGAWLAGLAVVGWVLRTLHTRYVGAPDRLLDQVRVVLGRARRSRCSCPARAKSRRWPAP